MTNNHRPAVRGLRNTMEDVTRRALLLGADAFGRMTARSRALPAALIIGGQRCGTTSLYKALVQQPTILRPTWRKGVHYFDIDYVGRDLDWYRAHFPLQTQLDRLAERHQDRALTFESSPYYMFHPLAMQRIADDLPDAKVIALVRDPVERAYSAHAHEFARGFEDLSFEAALDAEESRLADASVSLTNDPGHISEAHRHHAYRSRGEYAAQFERISGLIGRERLLVLDSHRFFTDGAEVLDEVLSFLGVNTRTQTVFEKHNARPRTTMDPLLRTRLETHYSAHDEALEKWLGHTPSWRKKRE